MADVFSESAPAAETPAGGEFITNLVGEGKKFKTVEDLAKAKLASDEHIARIEAENAEIRQKLLTAKTVEEQIKALNATKEVPKAPAETPAPAKEVDLNAAIRAELANAERQRAVSANIASVGDQMVKQFGSVEKAQEVVKAKAAALGVSTQFLQSTAAQSPQAFYSLMGLNTQAPVAPQAPRSETRPDSFRQSDVNQPAPGTYEAMREQQGRLDAKKLLDRNYLQASMEAAMKDPDKFFAGQAA